MTSRWTGAIVVLALVAGTGGAMIPVSIDARGNAELDSRTGGVDAAPSLKRSELPRREQRRIRDANAFAILATNNDAAPPAVVANPWFATPLQLRSTTPISCDARGPPGA